MDLVDTLVTQCIVLSWLRCCMEEGVDFINKQTGEMEKNEVKIFQHLQNKTGCFDVPTAKCSPRGLEKNLLEVIGSLIAFNDSQDIITCVISANFKTKINEHIAKIRAREFSGKLPK